nr:MAG TPA: Large subunit terminase [Caudoviricetes sp.]
MKQRTPTSVLHIRGKPNAKQKLFFASRARYTAYGGARGGGKSWALRRKLVALCLRYPTIRCLLVRRSYAELKANHVDPLLREYAGLIQYRESDKRLDFPNGSSISLGYCSSNRDVLRYQGQEYDIIAIDEATQLNEYQFSIFKACLRGVGNVPRRMYLTCNPGGVGHAWVKRLFIDRAFRPDENPADYRFIPAQVYDNPVLTAADPDYVRQLESLPAKLRDAWLLGRWDVFEGQFLPEFRPEIHVVETGEIPDELRYFAALDYGFDMLAALLLGADRQGRVWVVREYCRSGLVLGAAAEEVAKLCRGYRVEYLVASPDLWNRRQDTGRSGFEIMQAVRGIPPMQPADNRRIPGWRVLREYLQVTPDGPRLRISRDCRTLCDSLPALLCDASRPEDASDEPHAVTHAPEALRYALMSRFAAYSEPDLPDRNFRFPSRKPHNPLY